MKLTKRNLTKTSKLDTQEATRTGASKAQSLANILFFVVSTAIAIGHADAVSVEPDDFQNPLVFDFSDLALGTHLGPGYANPYEDLGIEFTGYVADYTIDNLQGQHLATGFANTSEEPFVVRISLLNEPALRIGGYVWPECGSATSVTAYDNDGSVIDRFTVSGCPGTPFMGLEATHETPIRFLEWRGLPGSLLTTFPRVDGIMVETIPEPATVALLALGGLMLRRRRCA